MHNGRVLILSDREMKRLIDWSETRQATETAYRHFSAGLANSPNRMRLMLREGSRFAAMPGADLETGALGAKLVGYYPDNPSRGLARVSAAYVLVDPVSGVVLSLMEGAFLTNIRTAVAAVVAAGALARRGWRRLGVIGSGALATNSAKAFLATERPEQIRLYSRTAANLARFAADLAGHAGVEIVACASPEDVVRGADVIVCATDTHTPVFDGAALESSQLVVSLGANTPATRELDLLTMKRGRFFVDSRLAVLAECGEVILPQKEGTLPADPVYAELGEVLNGTRPGRVDDTETLIFKSTGLAVQDALTAQLMYHRAVEQGVGVSVSLFG
jgi:ornithine cyclodeaminase